MSNESTAGTSAKTIGPITISCITPEASDLLDEAIRQYAEFKKCTTDDLCADPPGEPSVYGFAYWLFRYSGLVDAAIRARIGT